MVKKLTLCLIVILVASSVLFSGSKFGKAEILWDTWGVPHIYGKNSEGMFYAFGRAQMKCHGDLILKLYGESRGRAAEYWGETHLEEDISIRKLGVPGRGSQWFDAYSPQFKKYLGAFVKGMNDYAAEHKDKLAKDRLVVLPVTAGDVLAHTQRAIHLQFLVRDSFRKIRRWGRSGSNAWAIAPSHSQSGNAMLLANPHLAWSGLELFYEVHLIAPGLDIYGVTLVGLPMPIIAFNDYLGWTLTYNIHDGADLYELKPAGDGYLFDGKTYPYKREIQTVKIASGNGTFREQELVIEHAVHGPVMVKKKDKALALRVAGLDRPLIWEQWFEMAKARDLGTFEKALKRLQVPLFNVIYADRDGHIMMFHGAVLPKRSRGDWSYWEGIVPGDTSATLWTEYHPYEDLPRVVDPANGWVQNANEPPWTCTIPMILKPGDFPAYTSLPMGAYKTYSAYLFRPLRSIMMLLQDKKISFDEMVTYKHSTRMELAHRLLDDLFEAVKRYGNGGMKEAVRVLEKWDRKADADSRGAVLFEAWVRELGRDVFVKKWGEGPVQSAPDGLKNPQAAVNALAAASEKVIKAYGTLDIPWGKVYRIKYGGKDLPGNGGPARLGLFRNMYYSPDKNGTYNLTEGDTFIAAVEFSKPLKVRAVLGYGNASQPGSPHRWDQLELVSQKKLRPVWRTRKEIEKHLEKREVF